MGDRRMAEIKMDGGSLYVYVHSHGSLLPRMARDAVKAARGRLGDEGYWARIVIDKLTQQGRDQDIGFGISFKPDFEDSYNGDNPSVIIDAKDGSVTVIGSSDDGGE